MKQLSDNIDWDALEAHFAKASAPVSMGSTVVDSNVPKPITPSGLRLDSKRARLLLGKVRGESKAARRMRRRAVVG